MMDDYNNNDNIRLHHFSIGNNNSLPHSASLNKISSANQLLPSLNRLSTHLIQSINQSINQSIIIIIIIHPHHHEDDHHHYVIHVLTHSLTCGSINII